jgi:hypothetical protein
MRASSAISRLLAPRHELSCSWFLWQRLTARLRERGRNESRESGAFLLGVQEPGRPARIVDFILYDDLDPHSLDTGIIRFDGRHFGKLWSICRARRLAVAQMIKHPLHVLDRRLVARHRADAHQPGPKAVGGERQKRKQVADFIAFKEASKMENGYAARLKRPGDLVYPGIRPAQDGLVPQRDAVFFELPDAGRDTGGLVVRRIETANLRDVAAFIAAGFELERGEIGRHSHAFCECAVGINDVLRGSIVDFERFRDCAWEVSREGRHVGG